MLRSAPRASPIRRAYGNTVNTAARFCDAAKPRQVAVSERVVAAVADSRIDFQHRGTALMKGLDGEQTVYVAVPVDNEGADHA